METDLGTTILAEIVSSVPVATFAIDSTANRPISTRLRRISPDTHWRKPWG